jgi:hypothetical protein
VFDWGKSLHDGADNFLGSNKLSWEELDSQESKSWDNAVFKEQNAFEAYDGFGDSKDPTNPSYASNAFCSLNTALSQLLLS